LSNWEKLYSGFEQENFKKAGQENSTDFTQQTIPDSTGLQNQNIFQLKNKYIITPVKSGLMIIDQKRAHEKIMYEKLLKSIKTKSIITQQSLFPISIQLSASDHVLLMEIIDDICTLGFDIRNIGNNTVIINGCPSDSDNSDPGGMLEALLEEYKSKQKNAETDSKEKIAESLAKASSINYGKNLTTEEMREIIDNLFACDTPNYTPGGKPAVTILDIDEVEKLFK